MRLLSAETRAQWTVGIVLALIAGYLNGYGPLRLGVFVSFIYSVIMLVVTDWTCM